MDTLAVSRYVTSMRGYTSRFWVFFVLFGLCFASFLRNGVPWVFGLIV
jgi:hypothetical protein